MPQRTCVVCRDKVDKTQLTRIVRTPAPDTTVVVDPTGKLNGRGAYLCHKPTCWEAALGKRLLKRILEVEVSSAEIAALQAYYDQTIARTARHSIIEPEL